jgi:hypothetical protein
MPLFFFCFWLSCAGVMKCHIYFFIFKFYHYEHHFSRLHFYSCSVFPYLFYSSAAMLSVFSLWLYHFSCSLVFRLLSALYFWHLWHCFLHYFRAPFLGGFFFVIHAKHRNKFHLHQFECIRRMISKQSEASKAQQLKPSSGICYNAATKSPAAEAATPYPLLQV